ncbi:MAG: hypothetical protein AVDCRST_MAG41-4333, partial [uncultured Corynebacteriales bacterium]
ARRGEHRRRGPAGRDGAAAGRVGRRQPGRRAVRGVPALPAPARRPGRRPARPGRLPGLPLARQQVRRPGRADGRRPARLPRLPRPDARLHAVRPGVRAGAAAAGRPGGPAGRSLHGRL